jgi:hypothetical protein
MKARLSAAGEYVPTEREFERVFREAGCSKNVSRMLVSRLFDPDPGEMPDGRRWDAGDVDEVAAAKDEIERLTGRFMAGSLRV